MVGPGRERWSSQSGFVLAAVGSAVGLGNMWRFSYLAAENGGAAFVILYVGLTLAVGIPVLLAELAIGRGSQRSPVRALAHFGGVAWKPLGMVFVAAGFVILSYYGVIAGWTLRYAWIAISGGFGADIADRFGAISEGWDAFAFHVGFMFMTIVIVGHGVKAGIERASVLLMPVLFAIVVGLALYAATLDGAGSGYTYYLSADFSKLWDRDVIKDAAGQAFFSLSLGMGAMLTYASYLERDQNLPNESVVIAGADVAIAFVAGLVVFPLIFALGLSDKVSGSTVGTLFITLPQAFAEMGGVGQVVSLLFFFALIVGALVGMRRCHHGTRSLLGLRHRRARCRRPVREQHPAARRRLRPVSVRRLGDARPDVRGSGRRRRAPLARHLARAAAFHRAALPGLRADPGGPGHLGSRLRAPRPLTGLTPGSVEISLRPRPRFAPRSLRRGS
jgi:NSS family neurotransmitter:Na+ symporter